MVQRAGIVLQTHEVTSRLVECKTIRLYLLVYTPIHTYIPNETYTYLQ